MKFITLINYIFVPRASKQDDINLINCMTVLYMSNRKTHIDRLEF